MHEDITQYLKPQKVTKYDLFSTQKWTTRNFSPEIIIRKQFIVHKAEDTVCLHNGTFKHLILVWRPSRCDHYTHTHIKILFILSKIITHKCYLFQGSYSGSWLVLPGSSRTQQLQGFVHSLLLRSSLPVQLDNQDRGSAGWKWPVQMPGSQTEQYSSEAQSCMTIWRITCVRSQSISQVVPWLSQWHLQTLQSKRSNAQA